MTKDESLNIELRGVLLLLVTLTPFYKTLWSGKSDVEIFKKMFVWKENNKKANNCLKSIN